MHTIRNYNFYRATLC